MKKRYAIVLFVFLVGCSKNKNDIELVNNSNQEITVSVFGKPKKEFNNGNYKPNDWENNSGSVKVKSKTRIHLASTINDSINIKDLEFKSIKIIIGKDTIYKEGMKMLSLFKKNHFNNKVIWEFTIN